MDNVGNEYGKPKDVVGEQRTVFTSHADAAFDVCFENIMQHCKFSRVRPFLSLLLFSFSFSPLSTEGGLKGKRRKAKLGKISKLLTSSNQRA